MVFIADNKKGRFKNESGFVIDFRYLIANGYYFEFDKKRQVQIKRYLRDYQNSYVLEHWNKATGTCALWDSLTNNYITPKLPLIKQPFESKESYRLEIENINESIKPTYVIFYPNAKLVNQNFLYDIVEVN